LGGASFVRRGSATVGAAAFGAIRTAPPDKDPLWVRRTLGVLFAEGAARFDVTSPTALCSPVSSDTLSTVRSERLLESFESTRVKMSRLIAGDVTDRISKHALALARTEASASERHTRTASPMASKLRLLSSQLLRMRVRYSMTYARIFGERSEDTASANLCTTLGD